MIGFNFFFWFVYQFLICLGVLSYIFTFSSFFFEICMKYYYIIGKNLQVILNKSMSLNFDKWFYFVLQRNIFYYKYKIDLIEFIIFLYLLLLIYFFQDVDINLGIYFVGRIFMFLLELIFIIDYYIQFFFLFVMDENLYINCKMIIL